MVDVLEGYAAFPKDAFSSNMKKFYPLVVELLGKELTPDLRTALLLVLRRVGEVGLGIEGLASNAGKSKENGAKRRDSSLSVATAEHTLAEEAIDGSDDPSNRVMGKA